MKRKLIRQGGGGYTLYLPKKWVESKGLKAGEDVEIKETGTALIIDSSTVTKKQITLKLTDDYKSNIRNILTHIYRRGFDKIILQNTDEKIMESIKTYTKDLLLGFELTESEKERCVIENISEPSEEKYPVLIKRIYLILKETHRTIADDFKKGEYTNVKTIEEYKIQLDKFMLFCKRTLTKEKYQTDHPITDWELLSLLMHIEHAYYYMYAYASKNKIKVGKNTIDLFENLQEYLELHYNAYYKKDIKYINKINSLKKDFQFGKCYELIEKSKGKETNILMHIRELFRTIQLGISPVLSEYFEETL